MVSLNIPFAPPLRQVTEQTPRNRLADPNWNSIPDQSPEHVVSHPTSFGEELIASGERLKQSRLAQGYGAVLLRVAESTVSISKALGRDRGRGGIPFHASVHTRISFSRVLPVTLGQ
jgi:hypothetical protein